MKKLTYLLIFLGIFLKMPFANAQTDKYWVFFTDKDGTSFDPFSYFDQKAIERRIQHGINLYDPTDFPVREDYRDVVSTMVEALTFESRWFNAVSVRATEDQAFALRTLPFVTSVERQYLEPVLASTEEDSWFAMDVQTLKVRQIQMMQGGLFRKMGITGKGVRVAVFDGGFPEVNTHPAFQHIRDENRILKTWDFTKKSEQVYHANSHGLSVLSTIAGIDEDGQLLGLATGAEFILAITEVSSEPFKEEEWWLEAAEWADKNGAQLISSSLGYTYHRYFPQDMDGKTSLVSRAANMAASKGILVVNAAGNEGSTDNWKVIGAPADADSVLSVGGIDPANGIKVDFSSLGPTVDGRMKPNVSNAGVVAAAAKNGKVNRTQGTSFAAPLTTGFAACAMEAMPGKTNMEMFELIQQSAHLYPYFDYAHGYGMPQASFFTGMVRELEFPGIKFLEQDGYLKIVTDQYETSEDVTDELFIEEEDQENPMEDFAEQQNDDVPPPEAMDEEDEIEAPEFVDQEIDIEIEEVMEEVEAVEPEIAEIDEVEMVDEEAPEEVESIEDTISPEEIENAIEDETEPEEENIVIEFDDQEVNEPENDEDISGEAPVFEDMEMDEEPVLDYETEISAWDSLFAPYLYYHIQLPEGKLSKYAVVKVLFDELVTIDLEELPQGAIVRFFYHGYTGEWRKN